MEEVYPDDFWYILTARRSNMRTREELAKRIKDFASSGSPCLEYFAPTIVKAVTQGNRTIRTRQALACNYIFLRGAIDAIRKFRDIYKDYNLIKERSGEGYLRISAPDLENFRKVSIAYQNNMPCFRPDEVELLRGDRVRILDGQFAGIEGVLVTQKGRDGGRVIISIGNLLATETLDIAPAYIQILEFAPGSKHLYDKIDSFLPRLRRALHSYISRRMLPLDEAAPLDFFVRRFGVVESPSPKINAKLACLLLTATSLLGRKEESRIYRFRFLTNFKHVTNPRTRISLLSYHALSSLFNR